MKTETLDISINWKMAAEILARVLMDGTPRGQLDAMKELRRMASAADLYTDLINAAECEEDGTGNCKCFKCAAYKIKNARRATKGKKS